MQLHLTIQDFLGLWAAFALFPLLLILPGYVIGRWTGILSFNQHQHLLTKSLLLSVAVCPWVIFILSKFAGQTAAVGFLGVMMLGFLLTVFRDGSQAIAQLTKHIRTPRVLIALIAGLLFGTFMLVDFAADGYLIRMQMSHDYVKHIAVADAVARTGIPPINPSFYPGEALQLFYYYFWFMLCGTIDLIGGTFIGPRDAVLAGTLWCGLALVALVRLFLVTWGPRIVRGLQPAHYRWGYILLAITGIDILAVGADWAISQLSGIDKPLLVNVEWWNDQIVNWTSSVLWVPHHVSSFISCMVAFMIVVDQGGKEKLNKPFVAWLIAGIALASALGLSIWVALVAGFIMAGWLVTTALKKWHIDLRTALATSVLAVLLALPFVLDMQSSNRLSSFPIDITVRHFFNLHIALQSVGEPFISLAHLISLPINYGIELGFFGIGGLLYWTYRKKQETPFGREELFMWVMLGSSIFLCSFVRSAVVLNDMGWRGFLFAQFALLLFSIPLIANLFNKRSFEDFKLDALSKGFAVVFLMLSCLSMSFELFSLRFRYLGPEGPQTVQVREAYEWIDTNMPASAIVQHNPDYEVDYFHAQYGNRQVVVADRVYGALYGVDETQFEETIEIVSTLFLLEMTMAEGIDISRQLGIDALFVKQDDAIWHAGDAWVSTLEMIYESDCCRIYAVPTENKDTLTSAARSQ